MLRIFFWAPFGQGEGSRGGTSTGIASVTRNGNPASWRGPEGRGRTSNGLKNDKTLVMVVNRIELLRNPGG